MLCGPWPTTAATPGIAATCSPSFFSAGVSSVWYCGRISLAKWRLMITASAPAFRSRLTRSLISGSFAMFSDHGWGSGMPFVSVVKARNPSFTPLTLMITGFRW